MKCICGYGEPVEVKVKRGIAKIPDPNNSGDPFHRSQVERVFKMQNEPWVDNTEDKYLYACPKCGTVKIEL